MRGGDQGSVAAPGRRPSVLLEVEQETEADPTRRAIEEAVARGLLPPDVHGAARVGAVVERTAIRVRNLAQEALPTRRGEPPVLIREAGSAVDRHHVLGVEQVLHPEVRLEAGVAEPEVEAAVEPQV